MSSGAIEWDARPRCPRRSTCCCSCTTWAKVRSFGRCDRVRILSVRHPPCVRRRNLQGHVLCVPLPKIHYRGRDSPHRSHTSGRQVVRSSTMAVTRGGGRNQRGFSRTGTHPRCVLAGRLHSCARVAAGGSKAGLSQPERVVLVERSVYGMCSAVTLSYVLLPCRRMIVSCQFRSTIFDVVATPSSDLGAHVGTHTSSSAPTTSSASKLGSFHAVYPMDTTVGHDACCASRCGL